MNKCRGTKENRNEEMKKRKKYREENQKEEHDNSLFVIITRFIQLTE